MDQYDFSAIRAVKDRDEFKAEIVRFCHHLGFELMSAMTVVDRSLGKSDFVPIDNDPPEFELFFVEHPDENLTDPVTQFCKRSSLPCVWDEQTYRAAGYEQLWQNRAQFGCRTGICLALHLTEGRHFLLGFDRLRPLPPARDELTRMVANLQFFAVLAQEAAAKVLMPDDPDSDYAAMSGRELESLQLHAFGKTNFEIGVTMNVSENAAARLLEEATRKMFCPTAPEAAAKALRLKIFRLPVKRAETGVTPP